MDERRRVKWFSRGLRDRNQASPEWETSRQKVVLAYLSDPVSSDRCS
jgi:hypothetical protein